MLRIDAKPLDDRLPIGTPLNLKDDPNRVIEALRAMGDYPPLDKMDTEHSRTPWPAAVADVRYNLASALDWLSSKPTSDDRIVYGFQGLNRYVVRPEGAVEIIESQLDFTNGLKSRAEALQKARELGFKVK